MYEDDRQPGVFLEKTIDGVVPDNSCLLIVLLSQNQLLSNIVVLPIHGTLLLISICIIVKLGNFGKLCKSFMQIIDHNCSVLYLFSCNSFKISFNRPVEDL